MGISDGVMFRAPCHRCGRELSKPSLAYLEAAEEAIAAVDEINSPRQGRLL